MHDHVKAALVSAVDALANQGLGADRLTLHPATAAEFAIHGTHIDLGSARLLPDADAVRAELTAAGLPPEEAHALASPRCQSSLRRPDVVLEVRLDPAVPPGKLSVSGTPVTRHAQEITP